MRSIENNIHFLEKDITDLKSVIVKDKHNLKLITNKERDLKILIDLKNKGYRYFKYYNGQIEPAGWISRGNWGSKIKFE